MAKPYKITFNGRALLTNPVFWVTVMVLLETGRGLWAADTSLEVWAAIARFFVMLMGVAFVSAFTFGLTKDVIVFNYADDPTPVIADTQARRMHKELVQQRNVAGRVRNAMAKTIESAARDLYLQTSDYTSTVRRMVGGKRHESDPVVLEVRVRRGGGFLTLTAVRDDGQQVVHENVSHDEGQITAITAINEILRKEVQTA